ncbi:MAG: DUF86 domain-containing protein [Anaerolineae bacterium]|jgi:uncharacterized protein with HEPN domain|nr:DUF86 domain-containing protein [Anaerolineae bacterium]
MKKSDLLYLHHIQDAIERIERHLKGISRAEFFGSELLQDALVRQLEIMGEAAGHVSQQARGMHPEIPWSQIVGMRNRLVHAYFQVDLAIVWEIVQVDLPPLKQQVEAMLGTWDAR